MRSNTRRFPNIARLVRVSREKQNKLSQFGLVSKMGLKPEDKPFCAQFVSNIERGLCSVPAKKVKPLASALDLDITAIKEAMLQDYLLNLDREIEACQDLK